MLGLTRLLAVICGVVLFYQGIFIENIWNDPKKAYAEKIDALQAKHLLELKSIRSEYEKKIYIQSGATAYERIFNRPQATIEELIRNLAAEAFPAGWRLEVKVDEFVHTLLMAQVPKGQAEIDPQQVARYLSAFLEHAKPYLENVSIMDQKRIPYLFFDKASLDDLIQSRFELSESQLTDAIQKARQFQRFNPVIIDYQNIQGHMVVTAFIGGDSGSFPMPMMIDTGATNSVLTLEAAQRTGSEDLNTASTREYSTAGGRYRFPIVKRTIQFDYLKSELEVAVNFREDNEVNLLGVDFFKGKDYYTDSHDSKIYLWEAAINRSVRN